MPTTILLAEDEAAIAETVLYALRAEGFAAEHVLLGGQVLPRLARGGVDLVILDVGLPDASGFEICRRLREHHALPVIFLTARSDEIDRVLGLELGADDYVTKPFSPRELVLRVKKLLERGKAKPTTGETMKIGELLIDLPRHLVMVRGKRVELTATEFKLLTLLAQRRGRVQTRDALLHDVWDYSSLVDTRTVDTHMRRLREKLGPAAKHLDTVRGVGYRFAE